MSTLTVDLFSSVDGFAAGEGWPGYWGLEGPELFAHLNASLAVDHTVMMGATTYRLLSGIVAQQDDPTFARMAELPKVVFSRTLRPPLSWPNTRIVAEDAVTAIRAMKETSTTPLRTIGSLSLIRSLLAAGLVDRFQVVVFPVITGVTGREPIYQGMPDLMLEMVSSRVLDGRLQLLEYVPRLR